MIAEDQCRLAPEVAEPCAVLPVIFAAGCEIIFSKEKLFSKNNIPSAFFCGIVLLSTLVGLMALNANTANLGVGYADAYSNYSNMPDWLDNLFNLPEHWFALFGVDAAYGSSKEASGLPIAMLFLIVSSKR